MLSLALDASCDICLETYSSSALPYSLPCGHVLCAMCCVSIIDSSQTSTLCPFCRNPYTRDGVRVIRIESSNSSNTPLEDSVIESSSSTPSGLPAGLGSTGPYPTHGANCDFCGEQIRGSRYKCTQCPDFDSCSGCFTHVPIQHPRHVFVRILAPEDYLYETSRVPPAQHGAFCDHCSRPVNGVRYKCSHPACPDYDLCEGCEALPVPVHPLNHYFIKMRVPTSHISTPQRHQASCNACASQIVGIRYKCSHCRDYDLCERCEGNNVTIHPITHVFFKIKSAQAAVPTTGMMPMPMRF